MRIEVKLGGGLGDRGSGGGIQALESTGTLSVTEAIDRLGVNEQADDILAIVNDEVVPPGERSGFMLKDKDRLALIPQLKGG